MNCTFSTIKCLFSHDESAEIKAIMNKLKEFKILYDDNDNIDITLKNYITTRDRIIHEKRLINPEIILLLDKCIYEPTLCGIDNLIHQQMMHLYRF